MKYNFGLDKVLHIETCFIIVIIISGFLSMFGINLTIGQIIGLIGSIIIGFGKEYYDKNHGGIFDWQDIIADCIGGILGFLAIFTL